MEACLVIAFVAHGDAAVEQHKDDEAKNNKYKWPHLARKV
jgi:hypothetical protein